MIDEIALMQNTRQRHKDQRALLRDRAELETSRSGLYPTRRIVKLTLELQTRRRLLLRLCLVVAIPFFPRHYFVFIFNKEFQEHGFFLA